MLAEFGLDTTGCYWRIKKSVCGFCCGYFISAQADFSLLTVEGTWVDGSYPRLTDRPDYVRFGDISPTISILSLRQSDARHCL